MSRIAIRARTWVGFDYRLQREVERPREEWRAEITHARRTLRADGDLLLFDRIGGQDVLVAEVYDRDEKGRVTRVPA